MDRLQVSTKSRQHQVTSYRSKHKRRSNVWKLEAPTLVKCSNCGSFKLPHQACGNCGYYKGRQVRAVDEQ